MISKVMLCLQQRPSLNSGEEKEGHLFIITPTRLSCALLCFSPVFGDLRDRSLWGA